MVAKALAVAGAFVLALSTVGAFAYAPSSGFFGQKQSADRPQRRYLDEKMMSVNRAFALPKESDLRLQMADVDSQMFQRKSQFHLASDNVVIDNRPGFPESVGIRIFHWMSRVCVQLGAFNSSNPIVQLVTFVLYQLDIIWSGLDKEYYVKRREMFGPNFVSAASLVVSKYDGGANEPDAIDTRFLNIPQQRGDFLGSTIMYTDHLPQDRRTGKPTRKVSLLHVSDRGVEELKEGELDHDDLRESVMQNVLGEEKLREAKVRAEDDTTKAMLNDFANESKGISDAATLSPIVERFLIRYYHYVLFALPADEIPEDLLYDTFFKGLNYILYLVGPKWLGGLLSPIVRPKKLEEKLDRVAEYYATSPVLKSFVEIPPGDSALSRDGLLELLKMLIGVAALQGTKALAIASITQMPKGCARAAAVDPDTLRNAVLEVARLDSPVTGSHCIVNDKDGIKTTIGKQSLTFPRGTVLFMAMTLANTDLDRFDCPYVFDPDRQGMSENLTSFNSIGERTGKSPRICPGRTVALDCVCQMLKAKIDAEQQS